MDQRWLISRRALLGGVAGLGLSSYLAPRRAAAAPSAPARFIVVHVPEGMWSSAPRPAAGEPTFGPMLAPLEPLRNYVNVISNVDMATRVKGPGPDGHSRAVVQMLTGTEMKDETNAGGPSIDQRIAQTIGTGSKYASLQFAVRIVFDGLTARPIWAAAGRPLPAMQSPFEAYKRIFSDVVPGSASQSAVDLRRSALDYALGEINALRPRLPSTDQVRLDTYQESLRDIERRLAVITPATCVKPAMGETVDVRAEANYPAIGKLQMDLMVAALQCGLTNVCSLQWGNSNDQCKYSWLGVNALGHDLAHNNNNVDPTGSKKLTVYRWYAEQLAYLLRQLQAIPEGPGTMLDNTVVLWAQEFGSSNSHGYTNLQWVVMGNVAGRLRAGGQVIDGGGRSTNDVHAALLNAFGIPDKTFGNPMFCAGALPGLLV